MLDAIVSLSKKIQPNFETVNNEAAYWSGHEKKESIVHTRSGVFLVCQETKGWDRLCCSRKDPSLLVPPSRQAPQVSPQ